MKSAPFISVNMPVYNGERFIKEAIDSILSQTFSDFELIIVNDGSTDNTVEIIKSFSDPRITLLHNKTQTGLANVHNSALSVSRGKYIARMDSDDKANPERFQKQVDFLESHPSHCLVSSWVDYIDSLGKITGSETYSYRDEEISSVLFFHNCIAHPTVMLRKSMLSGPTIYNPDFIFCEDYELWIRLGRKFKIHIIREPLLEYRNHETNSSQNNREVVNNMVRKIVRVQWEDLGITDATEYQEDLQLALVYNIYNSDRDFVTNLSRLYHKLILANRKTKRFPPKVFEKLIKGYMNKPLPSFFVREKYGRQELRDLFGKDINAAFYLPKIKTAAIAAKSIINYKPANN